MLPSQTMMWYQTAKFKLILILLFLFLLLQFFLALKLYHNRIYVYNIAQIYILDRGVGENSSEDLRAKNSILIDVLHNITKFDSISTADDVYHRRSTIRDDPNSTAKPPCPRSPPNRRGPVSIDLDPPPSSTSFDRLLDSEFSSRLSLGGHFRPSHCSPPRDRVAVIIPYRDRRTHLAVFLRHMHRFLQEQSNLEYAIFVVEQISNQTFNRGKLLNVGYAESRKLFEWDCSIFHDVDLLPENDRNSYACPASARPRHMSVAVDKFDYELPYDEIFGGVTALRTDDFAALNGYSNDYWGWGGEDDDMYTRIDSSARRMRITRDSPEVARYKMIKHRSDSGNPLNSCRRQLNYRASERWPMDGLNNLNYDVLEFEQTELYTRVLVDLLESESRRRLDAEGACRLTGRQIFIRFLCCTLIGSFLLGCAIFTRRLRLRKRLRKI